MDARAGSSARSRDFALTAAIAGAFSAWTIYGARIEAAVWVGAALLAAWPAYRIMRWATG